jgi:hypothetical protein
MLSPKIPYLANHLTYLKNSTMLDYQPKIQKFSGDENLMQWLKDYMAKMDGPGGPGLKHVYIGTCLEGAALDWYSHDLGNNIKVLWPLFPRAFIAHWQPIKFDIHTVKVLQNLTPLVNICQPKTTHIPPTVANTTLNWATNMNESIGPSPGKQLLPCHALATHSYTTRACHYPAKQWHDNRNCTH